ncbi:YfiT family bacillithiol transferase [Paenactinomyces guangxiensis]|uniref:Putative metal-dependent hydrolase H1191_09090 n=1 Tax=Paenactinomyces guangxiensis TaxID=1490290 RepID=A0A7W1WR08_9BACL|nr:putative metal-dependent hydrolase [Paenactinomyces guangxiensis]MBA4494460.1 putative metal-dependent hydrolase [Paenactinomyces guangxiensis]MBH8591485.1 putative metal-dependent hydrolase [Paenactinomyces guangxiensis]
MPDVRYPIGKFKINQPITDDMRRQWLNEIETAPEQLRLSVKGLSDQQLDTPYRPEGWTIRQVVHHLPDGNLHGYIRFKLALSEVDPLIKTYDEGRWGELIDSRTAPIEISLTFFEMLHQRWAILLHSLTPDDFRRTYRHPESGTFTLEQGLALYAWHSKHHIAHITYFRERMGW